MSKHELIDAYLSGTINRRTFVRELTALGVSATVAASYAVALRPTAVEAGRDFYDYYPDDEPRKKKKKKKRKGKKKKGKKGDRGGYPR
jgi:hypothetical protein